MVQGNRKGALSSTSCEGMSNNNKQSHRRRLGYLVEHRSNLTPYLCDDQAVGVPDVDQVVKLINSVRSSLRKAMCQNKLGSLDAINARRPLRLF